MSQEIITALRRLYDGWSAGDLTAEMPLMDEHVALIVRPGVPTEGVLIGVDHLRQHLAELLEPWDRLAFEPESFREAGDSVLVNVQHVGVGAGSGVPAEMTIFHVWTFRAGKAIRLEVILEEDEALEAVGLRE
jgi:ketosteroid isomerase-like protein